MADITDLPDEQCYLAMLDGQRAGRLEYAWDGTVFVAKHVVVEPSYRGRGIGSALAAHVLGRLRADGVRLRPECPFVVAYLAEHPEYRSLVETVEPHPDEVA